MWEGNKNICFITSPHATSCGKAIKIFVFITSPHAISCGKAIQIFVFSTFPHAITDDSSLMTHQAQTSGSFQSRKGKGNKNICCLESIKGIAVEHRLSSPLAAKGATPLQKG
jgi:hypothetical protein